MKKDLTGATAMKITATRGSLDDWQQSGEQRWVKGTVATPHGFVAVYAHTGANSYYSMSFIYQGYEYTRTARVCPSSKTLATLAARLARDTVEAPNA